MNLTRRRLVGSLGAAGPLSILLHDVHAGVQAEGPSLKATAVVADRIVRPSIPDHFFSFNLNSNTLDSDHWDPAAQSLRVDVVSAMRAFPGAFYRYPGGNVANHLAWEWAQGDAAGRRAQWATSYDPPLPLRFGVGEYLDFVASVKGRSWYVLNLVGFSDTEFGVELPSDVMAASNGRLARLRAKLDRNPSGHRYYQLGNELDRNRYAWPVRKYVERCRDTMTAVRKEDPEARFVAFLRDFDIDAARTRGPRRGIDHAAEVLASLGADVEDVSLQVYYDESADEGERFDLSWRWRLVDRFVQDLNRQTGRRLNVWVTEHARARDLRARGQSRQRRLATTSGITGAVASADFCIAALQRPSLMATFWHALGGGVWWDLFDLAGGRTRPTPTYHVFRVLRGHAQGEVLETRTRQETEAAYAGGYDVSSIVLRGPERGRHTVLAANRASTTATLNVVLPAMSGLALRIETSTVAAALPDALPSTELDIVLREGIVAGQRAGPDGRFMLVLPPLSVVAARITPAETTGQ